MSENINETLGIGNKGNSSSNTQRQPHQTNTHFKTLLGYGKMISGLGWLLLIIGIIILFTSISGLSGGGMTGLINLYAIIVSVGFIISGALMIVFGQSISCFVAIEKNTRATHEIIRAQVISQSQAAEISRKTDEDQFDDDSDEISRDNLFK